MGRKKLLRLPVRIIILFLSNEQLTFGFGRGLPEVEADVCSQVLLECFVDEGIAVMKKHFRAAGMV